MRSKRHALFADFAQLVQTENLKTAGIRKDRPIPRHEFVQAAHRSNGLDAGSQIEVIGIGEQYLYAEFFEDVLRDALDGGERANRHEHGSFDFAVRGREFACASRASGHLNLQADSHVWIVNGSVTDEAFHSHLDDSFNSMGTATVTFFELKVFGRKSGLLHSFTL